MGAASEPEDEESEGEEVECQMVTAEATIPLASGDKRIEKRWKSHLLNGEQMWVLTVMPAHKGQFSVSVGVETVSQFAPGWYRDIKVRFTGEAFRLGRTCTTACVLTPACG